MYLLKSKSNIIYIAIADEKTRPYAFRVLNILRKNNLEAEINLKIQKINQQFKYANKKGFPCVITIGESEEKNCSVTLKNMESGHEEKNVSISNLIETTKLILKK